MDHNDRLPPHSPDAEQAVLGACLLDSNACIPICIERFGPDVSAFYDLRHQNIYRAMLEMYDARQPMDIITLQQRLLDNRILEEVGGQAYLSALTDAALSTANVTYYTDIVAEKHTLRRLISACLEIVGRVYEFEGQVNEALDRAEGEILAIRRAAPGDGVVPIKKLVNDSIAAIEALHASGGACTGIPTGFWDLDRMTSGLQAGEETVICGFTSAGKTSLAMNIAEHACVDLGLPTGVFSLEMSAVSLVTRMLCSRARVNLRNVRDGYLQNRDFPKLTQAADKIANTLLFVDDICGLSIFELRARARRMAQQHGIKLFIVDYIQLMNASGTGREPENRTKEVDKISHGLKGIAKELSCHVMVLSQTNDEGLLRDSRAIGQDADMVWRLETERDANPNDDAVPVDLKLLKQRNGPTGTVNLTFLRTYTRFESAAKICDDDVPTRQKELPNYDHD